MTRTRTEIQSIYELPLLTLLFEAQQVHRNHFEDEMELCAILSIKTGACPEDCAYCPQSAHYPTNVTREKLISLESILEAAHHAKANGAIRFCMGAAWRNIPNKQLPEILSIIRAVKSIGLETCMTLGMVTEQQAIELKNAGLDFYNHNIDTSENFYPKIISTRTFQDRLQTITHIHQAGIHICCGGILGMGETESDRIDFLFALTQLADTPKSIPINRLIPIPGTPLAATEQIDNFSFIRTIATARILFPHSMIRLSAGRQTMSHEMQTLCFLAGANSMWIGDTLLTAKNSDTDTDIHFLKKIGMPIKLNNSQLC